MAEFSEVMRQKKRMCNSVLCCKCDIYQLCGEDLSKCPQFISNNPKKAEEVIMLWAAEHPEPVYPTWGEWLLEQGILDDNNTYLNMKYWCAVNYPKLKSNIPVDIAQKLGLKPKENN